MSCLKVDSILHAFEQNSQYATVTTLGFSWSFAAVHLRSLFLWDVVSRHWMIFTQGPIFDVGHFDPRQGDYHTFSKHAEPKPRSTDYLFGNSRFVISYGESINEENEVRFLLYNLENLQ